MLQSDSQLNAYPSLLAPAVAAEIEQTAVVPDRITETPFELQIPSLQLNLSVAGVGLSEANAMDIPKGGVNDPSWQTAFWYRDSSWPGVGGTTTIAGHVTDLLGQPGAFGHLDDLQIGDILIVHDQASNLSTHYAVFRIETYAPWQANDPFVSRQIYGNGTTFSEPAYLTLITCTGDFINGSFVNRLVIYGRGVTTTLTNTYNWQ